MVDVRVGEDETVDVGGVESEFAVHTVSFETFALIHAAVEQDACLIGCGDEVLAAGDFACGTEEL